MRIGTKTVLFGVHQFILHPLTLAYCWYRMYGTRGLLNPLLWLTFFVHDIGYLGKPNIDGPEGERHPETGAWIMSWFGQKWHDLALHHSRFYALRDGYDQPSILCQPDKLTFIVAPRWLYRILSHATGEVHEYMSDETHAYKYHYMDETRGPSYRRHFETWHAGVRDYMIQWIEDNEDPSFPYKPGFRDYLRRWPRLVNEEGERVCKST